MLARLKAEGKIREYGIALDSVNDAVHCLRMDGIASLQMPFGLMDLEALHGVFDKAIRAPIRDHFARVFRWRRIKTVPHRSRSACN